MSEQHLATWESAKWTVSPMRRDLRGARLPLLLVAVSALILVPGLVGGGDVYVLAAAATCLLGFVLGVARFTTAPLVRGGFEELVVGRDEVRLGSRRIDRATLSQGVAHAVADGVQVHLRGRWSEPLLLHLDDAGAARELLAALGLDAQGRVAHFWAQSATMARPWFIAAVASGAAVLVGLIAAGVGAGWSPLLLVALAAAFMVTLFGSVIPVLFSVGLDGLDVRSVWGREFIPWHRVARVTPFRERSFLMEAGGIEIEVLSRAEPLRLPMATDRIAADTPERLAARIEDARAAAASIGASLTLAGSRAERVRTAKAVLEGRASYREGYVDPEAVGALVLDPHAEPEDRVAAARVLAQSESGRARVRIAADTTAERSLREALGTALAEADLDDAVEPRRGRG